MPEQESGDRDLEELYASWEANIHEMEDGNSELGGLDALICQKEGANILWWVVCTPPVLEANIL